MAKITGLAAHIRVKSCTEAWIPSPGQRFDPSTPTGQCPLLTFAVNQDDAEGIVVFCKLPGAEPDLSAAELPASCWIRQHGVHLEKFGGYGD
jgi:hypothetical protein